MSNFKPGNTSSLGRRPGSRNRLQGKFLDALAKDFEEHGEGVVRICRIEKPIEYLKIIAGVLPKEFLISDSPVEAMTEEEIVETINNIRKARAAATAH